MTYRVKVVLCDPGGRELQWFWVNRSAELGDTVSFTVPADLDWLLAEMEEAEREYTALPENARPVVVPPDSGPDDGGFYG